MKIIRVKDFQNKEISIALFGFGLIGANIAKKLIENNYAEMNDIAFDWYDLGLQKKAIREIIKILHTENVHLIWSAGNASFFATSEEIQKEMETFENIINLCLELHRCQKKVTFHHFSSAGGLYDGLVNIDSQTPLCPKKPYGFGKLNQEKKLKDFCNLFNIQIYRPTSIYGLIREGQKMGLVSILVKNVLQSNESIIYGSLNTLRDYVFIDDIVHFIITKIMRTNFSIGISIHILANGKPTSIYEVIRIIKRNINKSVYLRYDSKNINDQDITYSEEVCPNEWFPTELQTGVIKIIKDYFQYGGVF
jgi:UDP-glucose 4-epimerase